MQLSYVVLGDSYIISLTQGDMYVHQITHNGDIRSKGSVLFHYNNEALYQWFRSFVDSLANWFK